MVEDYTIEVRGDRTVLPLTFTNIPGSDDWDAFYDGTDLGWDTMFALMRYCLERHPGSDVTKAGAMGRTAMSPPEVYAEVRAMLGDPQGRYEVTTPLGDRWSGEVVFDFPPRGRYGNNALSVSVSELGDALFHVGVERHGDASLVYGGLILFGDADEAAAGKYRDLVTERLALTPLS